MIFISGIHGVGKSYFTEEIKRKCNIEAYTASSLISDYKKCSFESSKLASNISDNQQILIEELRRKESKNNKFVLDGHFCLLNKNGEIERIEFSTFTQIAPKAILLLTEDAEIIADRRKCRDGIEIDIGDIDSFQNEEKQYALEVAEFLNVPIFISSGSKDLEKAIDFIIKNI